MFIFLIICGPVSAQWVKRLAGHVGGTGQQIWTCRTEGPVNSGLAIAGTTLYAGSDDGYLYAIDIGTGSVAWRYKTGGPVRSRILVAAGVVYFGSHDHHIYAVRAGTGTTSRSLTRSFTRESHHSPVRNRSLIIIPNGCVASP